MHHDRDREDVISVNFRYPLSDGGGSGGSVNNVVETKTEEQTDTRVTTTTGTVPISDAHWEMILSLYLKTYRGPNAKEKLLEQLKSYQVLRKVGHVARGRYIRYLPRGIVDVELRRGGWVVKCTSKTIHLQDGRRKWRVSRRDNYIFVRNEDAEDQPIQNHRKSILRLIAEETLWQDEKEKHRERYNDYSREATQGEEEIPPLPRLRANFRE